MALTRLAAVLSWPDLDWKSIVVSIITLVIGGVLTAIGYWMLETRRKINFSGTEVYFGPALQWNLFMGRNYPSEDAVGLTCGASFFSNKSVPTGLQNFRLEFCRSTYMGKIVEFSVKQLWRDWLTNEMKSLQALELPSRQFERFELSGQVRREDWEPLKICSYVRLACETPEGNTKHFPIGPIRFPSMPPQGLRGPEYCGIQIAANVGFGKVSPPTYDGKAVIAAVRRQKAVGPPGQMPSAEDIRYWDGNSWVRSVADAKAYADHKLARDDGESIRIWNNVPSEWLNDERRPKL